MVPVDSCGKAEETKALTGSHGSVCSECSFDIEAYPLAIFFGAREGVHFSFPFLLPFLFCFCQAGILRWGRELLYFPQVRPPVLSKAMRCLAVTVGLPNLLLPCSSEKERRRTKEKTKGRAKGTTKKNTFYGGAGTPSRDVLNCLIPTPVLPLHNAR